MMVNVEKFKKMVFHYYKVSVRDIRTNGDIDVFSVAETKDINGYKVDLQVDATSYATAYITNLKTYNKDVIGFPCEFFSFTDLRIPESIWDKVIDIVRNAED